MAKVLCFMGNNSCYKYKDSYREFFLSFGAEHGEKNMQTIALLAITTITPALDLKKYELSLSASEQKKLWMAFDGNCFFFIFATQALH